MSTGLYYGLRKETHPKVPSTLTATPSEIPVTWVPVPLAPSGPNESILTASESIVSAIWVTQGLSVFGPQSVIVPASESITDAFWLTVELSPNEPTTELIIASESTVDAVWVAQLLTAEDPTETVIQSSASEVEAVWNEVDLLPMSGSGAACVSGGAYMEAATFSSRLLTDFALSGWFQVSVIQSNTIVSRWDFPGDTEWLVLHSVSGLDFLVQTNGSIEGITHPGPVGGFLVNTWYFFYAQRTATNMQLWVGTLADMPVIGPQKTISGVTDISSTTALFGASRTTGSISSPLEGRLDSFSFWQDIPPMTINEIWATGSYGQLTPPQKVNLGSWWDFADKNSGFPTTWTDSHAGFNLTSVPSNGIESCDGRTVTTPSTFVIHATGSDVEATWNSVGLTVDSATQSTIAADASEVQATWLDITLNASPAADSVIQADFNQVQAVWLDVGFVINGITESFITAKESVVETVWIENDIAASPAISFEVAALPSRVIAFWAPIPLNVASIPEATIAADFSEVEAVWNQVGLTPSGPSTGLILADASEIETTWNSIDLTVNAAGSSTIVSKSSIVTTVWNSIALTIGGATQSTIVARESEIQASWVVQPLTPIGPATALLSSTRSEVQTTWLAPGLDIEGPSEHLFDADESEIDAVWLPVPLTIGASNQSICFTDSDFSWGSRDIFAKTGALGFETGAVEGHLSVWIKNPDFNSVPSGEASFILTVSNPNNDGPRLQFGITADTGSGSKEAFFESDDGTNGVGGFGTITGQTADFDLDFNPGEWNHLMFAFDRDNDPNPLDTGIWRFWINGQEYTVTYSTGVDGKWFAHTQDSELFGFLTLTADLQGGTPADSFGVCLDEMILRAEKPTQALADFYYNSGNGVLIQEITDSSFAPTVNDYAWKFTDQGTAGFGDESWGNSIVPRDTIGFFDIANGNANADGITGNGSPTAPPT